MCQKLYNTIWKFWIVANIGAFVICATFEVVPSGILPSHCSNLFAPQKQPCSSRLHMVNRVVDRYFQLEESEDAETCTSEVFLNADGSVFIGETNGPLPARATGTWQQSPDGQQFTMNISRTFSAGQPQRSFTDVGEFDFTVERIFEASEISTVGTSMSIEGSIYDVSSSGEYKVGFFSMIDTTDAKLGEDEEEQQELGLPRFPKSQSSW